MEKKHIAAIVLTAILAVPAVFTAKLWWFCDPQK